MQNRTPAFRLLLRVLPAAMLLVSCGGRENPRQSTSRFGSKPPGPSSIEELVKEEGRSASTPISAEPPPAREVSRRALVLRALAAAALFPREGEGAPAEVKEHFEAQRERVVAWMERESLWDAASTAEKELLRTPVGKAPKAKPGEAKSRREELVTLLWALGGLDSLPAHDAGGPASAELLRKVPDVGSSTARYLEAARLRSAEEVEAAREAAEIWHWRARAREFTEQSAFPRGTDLDEQVQDLAEKARAEGFRLGPIRDGETYFHELIRFAAHYAHRRGLIEKPIEEDFPALGKGYAKLTAGEFRTLRDIAASRHRALSWLAGRVEDWGEPAPVES